MKNLSLGDVLVGNAERIIELKAQLADERATSERLWQDAERYRYLRERDLEAIEKGGVFAGSTPANIVMNGIDLDEAVDKALAAYPQPVEKEGGA